MLVQVTLWYVPGCAECIGTVETTTAAAIRDFSVTKLTLGAGHKHNHPTEQEQKKLAKGGSAAPAPALESKELFPAPEPGLGAYEEQTA